MAKFFRKYKRKGFGKLDETGLRFYLDKSSDYRIGEVERSTTVRSLCADLAKKFKIDNHADYTIVEHLADLHLERSLEDHELVLPIYDGWRTKSESHTNKFYFRKDIQRYEYINNPTDFFPTDMAVAVNKEGRHVRETITLQRHAIQETLSGSERAPTIHGEMSRRQEETANWAIEYFVLKDSKLYHTKTFERNTCSAADPIDTSDKEQLAEINNYSFYSVLDGHKIFNAEFAFYFCLKHDLPDMQGSEQFHYFACENGAIRLRWITALRINKYGKVLRDNIMHYKLLLGDPKCADAMGRRIALLSDEYSDYAFLGGPSGVQVITDPVAIQRAHAERIVTISGGLLYGMNFDIHMALPWFHQKLTLERSEKLLTKHKGENGVFLICGREHDRELGKFVLEYTFAKKIVRTLIKETGTHNHHPTDEELAYKLDGDKRKFYDLIQLVEFHQLNRGGLQTKLRQFVGPQGTELLSAMKRK